MGCYSLKPLNIQSVGWKYAEDIYLEGMLAEEWSYFIVKLNTNFIKLVEEVDDSLCWSQNLAIRVFIAKLGYKVQDEVEFVHYIVLVRNYLEACKYVKSKILLWIALSNKLLTWDNGLECGWTNPNKCFFR